jgi:biopolymer transport protein ExbD
MIRRRRRITPANMLPITSMLDMFTIILVFLLNFLDPDKDTAAIVELPPTTIRSESKGEALLVIAAGEVLLGPAGAQRRVAAPPGALDTEALGSGLEALRGAFPAEQPPLVVAVDRSVPWKRVAEVLRAASDAGFGDFRFVATKQE